MQAMDVARYSCPGAFWRWSPLSHDRVSVNVYGFYYGEVDAPVAQVDVPIRTTRFLTITPSYLYYEVPPSGLDTASAAPGGFHRHLRRAPISNRRDREVLRSRIRDLEPQHVCQAVPSDRRHQPLSPANRDRASPRGQGRIWKPFATYEAFYERSNGGWNRDRVIGRRHAAAREARARFSPPTSGSTTEFEDYGTSTTCCLD